MRGLNGMINEKLNSSFYKKNAAEECFTNSLNIFAKSLKKIMLVLFFVPNIIISPHELTAESQGREIQNFVNSGTTLQARKMKAYENAQKDSGLKIKRYLINKSVIQSKKGKSLLLQKKWLNRDLSHERC